MSGLSKQNRSKCAGEEVNSPPAKPHAVYGETSREGWENALLRGRAETVIFQLFWESNCTLSPFPDFSNLAHVLSLGEQIIRLCTGSC